MAAPGNLRPPRGEQPRGGLWCGRDATKTPKSPDLQARFSETARWAPSRSGTRPERPGQSSRRFDSGPLPASPRTWRFQRLGQSSSAPGDPRAEQEASVAPRTLHRAPGRGLAAPRPSGAWPCVMWAASACAPRTAAALLARPAARPLRAGSGACLCLYGAAASEGSAPLGTSDNAQLSDVAGLRPASLALAWT